MDNLGTSQNIIDEAYKQVKPAATILALSGGDDSLTTYHVAKKLGVKIDFILHVNTRTGIQETTDFVRSFAESESIPLIEADAGGTYENYVLRKGFFGRGEMAHRHSYHLLKAQHLRRAISQAIRKRRRNLPVLILNGARSQESINRRENFRGKFIRCDPAAKSNHWVNLIHYWGKMECKSFLSECEAKRNSVTELLCRSGECLCGTMQSDEVRREASFWFPAWGRWLDDLERRVIERFPWKWGRDVSRRWELEKYGQQTLPEFQPLCQSCVADYERKEATS